ncbi:MAG: divalent-cation tolerance protein CutA [Rickettsiales bacterium]
MQNYCSVYMAFGSKINAEEVIGELLEGKLIACANIICGVTSMYEWNGEIKKDNEVVVFAKTKHALFDQVVKKVKEMHSYDCPCIIKLAVSDGYKPYLDWLSDSCK